MPAAQENPNSDPDLRRKVCAELWTSFAALIRSYVAAHDLAKPASEHARVEQREAGKLKVQSGRKALALDFDPAQGMGSWAIYENDPGHALDRGKFEVGEDSQVALSDRPGKLELEVAAEAFTAKVFD